MRIDARELWSEVTLRAVGKERRGIEKGWRDSVGRGERLRHGG